MGANLLSTPDLLCNILIALRKALPSHIAVLAKIRLLPDQNDTIDLVKRIVNTGVSCLTVHCRTKEMRPRERALVHRLKELVGAVESTGLGVPVIENGDCASRDDALRLKELTGMFMFSSFYVALFGPVRDGTCSHSWFPCGRGSGTSGRPLIDLQSSFDLSAYLPLGAHSVMIATAAEKNLSCFRLGPLADR